MCGSTQDLSQEKSLCSTESSQPPALWEGGSPDPQAKGLLSQNTEASQRDSSQGLWPADKSRGPDRKAVDERWDKTQDTVLLRISYKSYHPFTLELFVKLCAL